MKERLRKLRLFLNNPTHSRTLTVLVILLIVAAIPLTVFIAQKQQELRQHASGSCNATNCSSFCDSGGTMCYSYSDATWVSRGCSYGGVSACGAGGGQVLEMSFTDRWIDPTNPSSGTTTTSTHIIGHVFGNTLDNRPACVLGGPGNITSDSSGATPATTIYGFLYINRSLDLAGGQARTLPTAFNPNSATYNGGVDTNEAYCDSGLTGTVTHTSVVPLVPTPTTAVNTPTPTPGPIATPTPTSAPGFSAPTLTSVTTGCNGTVPQNTINWSGGNGASSFTIFRDPLNSSAISTISSSLKTYTDTTAANNTWYNYWVSGSYPDSINRASNGQWIQTASCLPVQSPTPSPSTTPTGTPYLPADMNHDNCVGQADFDAWKYAYQNPGLTQSNTFPDTNGNGIGLDDYNIWFNAMVTLNPSTYLCPNHYR